MSAYRIWLDDRGETFCLVSAEDHVWALQWKWTRRWNKRRKKKYAVRHTRERGTRRNVTIFLHKEIVERHHGPAPTPAYTIGDHGDGDSLNNQRGNLSWATPKSNRATARPAMRRAA